MRNKEGLLDTLAHKLQEVEQVVKVSEEELQERRRVTKELDNKLQATEQFVKASAEQREMQASMIQDLNQKLQAAQNDLAELKHKEKLLADENGNQRQTLQERAELIEALTTKLNSLEVSRALVIEEKQQVDAQNIVKNHVIAGMSLGLMPAPLFDVAALTGAQLNMLRSLAQHYGIEFDEKTGKAVLLALVNGSVPVLTVVGLSSFAKLIPGIGTLGGGISMTVISGALTYATGQVFIQHFSTGGTLDDFDAKQWQSFFKQKFAEGKVFVKEKLQRDKKTTNVDNVATGV